MKIRFTAMQWRNTPKPDWQNSYISAYATMHPWEDFAETWGTVLDTAKNVNLL
ncbi:putative zinc-binding metallopeptidase [Pontibacter silvestris]|nr:putative zinc-binding metallopeptidase [Pontibacter silvestris]MCC9136081.1 putative zinc-binding metallopeptidase [Pontibacter silvestris]